MTSSSLCSPLLKWGISILSDKDLWGFHKVKRPGSNRAGKAFGFFIFYFAAPVGPEPVILLFQPPEYAGFQGVSPRPAVNPLNFLSKCCLKEWP